MSTYLCIDPGFSHTGIAISDSTYLVEPLNTIHAKDLSKIVAQLLLIIRQQNPDQIIVGQPTFGPIHSLAQDLFTALKPHFRGQLHLFSEDLSSKIAVKKLVHSGGSKQSRRDKHHSAAAAVILQNYLESIPPSSF